MCEREPGLAFARCYGSVFVCVSSRLAPLLLGLWGRGVGRWMGESGMIVRCGWGVGVMVVMVDLGGGLLFRSPYATLLTLIC